MNAPKHALCDRCRRNYHKVAIRHADGTVTGECPSCYSPTLKQAANRGGEVAVQREAERRRWLADNGATLVYDRRGRRPEWTPEMVEHALMLEEMISNFSTDSFADRGTLLSYKRQLNRLILGVHA